MIDPSASVSVIVPVFDDAVALENCLAALARQDHAGPVEIIVVDNAPRFSLARLAERHPEATFLWEPRPGSYRARNRALGEAQGEIIAFTDSDCRPHPGWLSAAVAALAARPELGFIGGRVRVVPAVPGNPATAELFDQILAFPQRRYVETGGYAVTANMVARRSVIDQVGGFDAGLKSGGDAEWGQRAVAAGYARAYVEAAVVDHPARRSWAEIAGKLRRTAGGARDRSPEWRDCLAFVARHAVPPRRHVLTLLEAREPEIGWPKRAQLIGWAIMANWVSAYERARLQLSRAPSARR